MMLVWWLKRESSGKIIANLSQQKINTDEIYIVVYSINILAVSST